MKTVMVYMTASSLEQARDIADKLVSEKLAACVNIFPGMESVYRWKGSIEKANETAFIAKTPKALVERLTQRVRQLHGYEVPCIVSVPIEGGNQAFLDWIVSETL